MKLEFETVTQFGEFIATIKRNRSVVDFEFAAIIKEHWNGKTNLAEYFETEEDAKRWLEKVMPSLKMRSEIESLKNQWTADPCWDIECTEGFELYADELEAFSDEVHAQNQAKYDAQIQAVMDEHDCSFKMAEHVTRLEERLVAIENKMYFLKSDCFGE